MTQLSVLLLCKYYNVYSITITTHKKQNRATDSKNFPLNERVKKLNFSDYN